MRISLRLILLKANKAATLQILLKKADIGKPMI